MRKVLVVFTCEGKLEPVDGEAVVIPGFESIEFFVYKSSVPPMFYTSDFVGYMVSEKSTGCSINLLQYKHKERAIAAAKLQLEAQGLDNVQKRIKEVRQKTAKGTILIRRTIMANHTKALLQSFSVGMATGVIFYNFIEQNEFFAAGVTIFVGVALWLVVSWLLLSGGRK